MATAKYSIESVRSSFFHILSLLLSEPSIPSKYVHCLIKWGMHLHLGVSDVKAIGTEHNTVCFHVPEEKVDGFFEHQCNRQNIIGKGLSIVDAKGFCNRKPFFF